MCCGIALFMILLCCFRHAVCLTGQTCTFYRTSYKTESYRCSRYTTSCGFLGLGRCTRYRTCYRSVSHQVSYTACCAGYGNTGSGHCAPKCHGSFSCSNGGTCSSPDHCNCPTGFYSPRCQACPVQDIANCHRMSCSAGPSNKRCLQCQDSTPSGSAYELSNNRCIPKCSWLDRWCWPGTCSNGRTSSCRCSSGFYKTGVKCDLSTTNQPTLSTCRLGTESQSGEVGNSTAGSPSTCERQQNFYVKFQPSKIAYEFTFLFTVNNVPTPKPIYIHDYVFGISGGSLTFKLYTVTESSNTVKTTDLATTSGSCTASFSNGSPQGSPVTCRGNPSYPGRALNNGERVCIEFKADGTGYVRIKNLSYNSISGKHYYRKVSATNDVCMLYDNNAPVHCYASSSCPAMTHWQHDPILLSAKITKSRNINVDFGGWTDLSPSNIRSQASGIASYTFTLHNMVEKGAVLGVDHTPLSVKTIDTPPSSGSTSFVIPDTRGLYAVYVSVLDVAENARLARRFVLFDESSKVLSTSTHPFQVTSASPSTDYTWQTHTGNIIVEWTNHFYNDFHYHTNMLKRIEADPHVDPLYDQTRGSIPVSGTSNVHGILNFAYAVVKRPGQMPALSTVPGLLAQTVTLANTIRTGESYEIWVKATDVMGNSKAESIIVHIDASNPIINDAYLDKDGHESIFVHSSDDLSVIKLQFNAMDGESGLYHVKWRFGTSQGSNDISSGSLPVVKTNDSTHANTTYCPSIHPGCEDYNYRLNLNHLKARGRHQGNHNRIYHVTLEVMNNARLTTLEHIAIHVDISPPATGVVMDGRTKNDIDFQSDYTLSGNWHGFFDHESGIKNYRYAFYERCLTKTELGGTGEWEAYLTTASSASWQALKPGRFYLSVLAYNQAVEASSVSCSNGVTIDPVPPSIKDVSLVGVHVNEGISCDNDGVWFIFENNTKCSLEATGQCNVKCEHVQESDLSLILPVYDTNSNVSQDCMGNMSRNMCESYPYFNHSEPMYLSTDHIRLKWRPAGINKYSAPIGDYRIGFLSSNHDNEPAFHSTHGSTFYNKIFSGMEEGELFYVHIVAINKAGQKSTTVVGPIIVDESPPLQDGAMAVSRVNDSVILKWNSSTFFDSEYENGIDKYQVAIGTPENYQASLAFTRMVPTEDCVDSDMCIHIREELIQRHNSAFGHNYMFTLKVFNKAGLSANFRSNPFSVPSQIPPSPGLVFDIDPNGDQMKDIDFFQGQTFCAAWSGFESHYDAVEYHIALGSSKYASDISHYSPVSGYVKRGDTFVCVPFSNVPDFQRIYASVKGKSGSGSAISSSDGAVYIGRESSSTTVLDGHGCGDVNSIKNISALSLGSNMSMIISLGKLPYFMSRFSVRLSGPFLLQGVDVTIDNNEPLNTKLNKSTGSSEVIYSFQWSDNPLDIKINNRGSGALDPLNVELHPCSVDEDYQSRVTWLRGYWHYDDTIHSHVSHYECAVTEEICRQSPSDGQPSCSLAGMVRSWENQGEDEFCQFSDLSLHPGKRYNMLMRPCFQHLCLAHSTSDGVLILPVKPTPGDIDVSVVSSGISGDYVIRVSARWHAFRIINDAVHMMASAYEWTLSPSESAHEILHPWKSVLSHNTSIKVYADIKWSHHKLKNMFLLLRAYAPSGVYVTVNRPIVMTDDVTTKIVNAVHELTDISVAAFKGIVHSSFIPTTTLKRLHESEVDFTNKTNIVTALLAGPLYDSYDWFLATVSDSSLDCESSQHCVKLITNSENSVHFEDISLQHGHKYFTCVRTSTPSRDGVNHVNSPPSIAVCSNGFVVDTEPPRPGHVIVTNSVNGFVTSLNTLSIQWSNFVDLEEPAAYVYSGVKSYSYCVGTAPGLDNVVPSTGIGTKNNVIIDDLSLDESNEYYATVTAEDHAGQSTTVSSNPFVMDVTPPTKGHIRVGSPHLMKTHLSSSNLEFHWFGFEDKESGIFKVEISVGSEPYFDDVFRSRVHSINTAVISGKDFIDGHTYYPQLKVFNNAGLVTLSSGSPFIYDSSPPSIGFVRECTSLNSTSDIDYQTDTSQLCASWDGFHDPHSAIAYYRVGIAEEGATMTSSFEGTQTSVIFQTTLKSGRKYVVSVEACNIVGLCTQATSDGVVVDTSPPLSGIVYVGHRRYRHNHFQASRKFFSASWHGFLDPESEIDFYQWCIGTSVGECDIQDYRNCHNSRMQTRFDMTLPVNTSIYVTVRAWNKAGMSASRTSEGIIVDVTPPVVLTRPSFSAGQNFNSHYTGSQFETNVLHINWKTQDPDSFIARQQVSVLSRNNGLVPVVNVELGNIDHLVVSLEHNMTLVDGGLYYISVTSCNGAGLCTVTNSVSDLLVDSSPPHIGRFIEPISWVKSSTFVVELFWDGFIDPHSDIKRYYISIGSSYSSNDLSGGSIPTPHVKDSGRQTFTLQLTKSLSVGDEVFISILAENHVGLRSSILKVKADVVQTDPSSNRGILVVEKHSCIIQYCNNDCTCSPVGQKCVTPSRALVCNNSSSTSVDVHFGITSPVTHSPNQRCLTANWSASDPLVVKRYEYSLGIAGNKPGSGVFDGSGGGLVWHDIDLWANVTYCLPQDRFLQEEDYIFYVRAWLSNDLYATFSSDRLNIDVSAPKQRRGRHVIDCASHSECSVDIAYTVDRHQLTANWAGVFTDPGSGIDHYEFMVGTTPGNDDVSRSQLMGSQTMFTAANLNLSQGLKYYTTIRAFNGVGLHATSSSDGVVIDSTPPVAGVVYNTRYFHSIRASSNTSCIWSSWQGFDDFHSHVSEYFVSISSAGTLADIMSPTSFGIQNTVEICSLNLQHNVSYTTLVEAKDAAGHVTSVRSDPVLIDVTPPVGYTCQRWRSRTLSPVESGFSRENSAAYNSYSESFIGNTEYLLVVKSSANYTALTLKFRGQYTRLEFKNTVEGNPVVRYSFTSDGFETLQFQLFFDDSSRTNIDIQSFLWTCDKRVEVEKKDVGLLKQLNPVALELKYNIKDGESDVRRHVVGLGTTHGGFQVSALNDVGKESYSVYDIDLPHGTPIYATIISENNAGLKEYFHSLPLKIDHSPPKITDIKVNLEADASTTLPLTLQLKYTVGVSWSAVDDESGILKCEIRIGFAPDASNLQQLTAVSPTVTGGATYRYLATYDLEHGKHVYVTIQCSNVAELAASLSAGPYVTVHRRPGSSEARVNFIKPQTYMYEARDAAIIDVDYFYVTWSGFQGYSEKLTYKIRVLKGNDTYIDWTDLGSQTNVIYTNLSLTVMGCYHAEVKASNSRNITSDVAVGTACLDTVSPQLTGKDPYVTQDNGVITVNWKFTFVDDVTALWYEICLGSLLGACDILQPTDFTQQNTSVTRDASVTEIFGVLTAVKPSGKSTTVLFSKTLN